MIHLSTFRSSTTSILQRAKWACPNNRLRRHLAALALESLEPRLALTDNLQANSVYLASDLGVEIKDFVVGEELRFAAKWLSNVASNASVTIEFVIDGESFQTLVSTASVGSDRTYRSISPGWYARPGHHTLEVRVDSDNSIIEANEADNHVSIEFTPISPELAAKFQFPVPGQVFRDWRIFAYVDADTRDNRVTDYRGGPFAYDGHLGIDIGLSKRFSAMDRGVPVFAAAPGVVTDVIDGNFDRETTAPDHLANWVVLDHGGGFSAIYAHLATNTVTVKVGDHVAAGQVLGLVGSSGSSKGAHLHFEVTHNGRTVETNLASETYWAQAIPYMADYPTNVLDSAITNYSFPAAVLDVNTISDAKEKPSEVRVFPASSTWDVNYWVWAVNYHENDVAQVRWYRPDGSVEKHVDLDPISHEDPVYSNRVVANLQTLVRVSHFSLALF